MGKWVLEYAMEIDQGLVDSSLSMGNSADI
jgi:hypothetical protein